MSMLNWAEYLLKDYIHGTKMSFVKYVQIFPASRKYVNMKYVALTCWALQSNKQFLEWKYLQFK